MKIFIFLADGFEEIEAIAPIDIFRRAEIDVTTVSINKTKEVTGAHQITILADEVFDQVKFEKDFLLFLPGGLPGTTNLDNHVGLKNLIQEHSHRGKKIAAICAAPTILGKMGILSKKEAICYPGFEDLLVEAELSESSIVIAESIFTAKAAGVALKFALKIVEDLKGKALAEKIAGQIYLE